MPILVDSQSIQKNPDYFLTYMELIKYLTEYEDCNILSEAKERLTKILKHTIPFGRQFEGIGVVNTYRLIESPQNLTQKNIKLAYVLSWCTAMQNASYYINDDILDREETRKGFPSWHTIPGNTHMAINDSFLVQNAVFVILRQYLSIYPCYLPILELFNRTNYKIALGQAIDVMCKTNGKPRFEEFTRERYEALAEYKSWCFAYEFTIKSAMYLANIDHTMRDAQIRSIMSKIGLLFNVHDDVQDSFSKAEMVGKRNTDTSNGKFTWLVVEALARGTPIQKQLLMEHYGKHCIESERVIQNLFKELNLFKVYKEFENKVTKSVQEEAKYLADIIPEQVFFNLLADITQN